LVDWTSMPVAPGERLNTSIAAARENWKGQLIAGKFPLLNWLGSSGSSAVFLTTADGRESAKAAIKVTPAENIKDADRQITRWDSAKDLTHPHLLRLFQAGRGQVNGTELLYLVMEYAEENLGQVLPVRSLTPEEAREMLPPVIDALSYIHRKNLVHGRIRPSNILVVSEQLKISSDSLRLTGDPTLSRFEPGPYDAPEVARGETSPAADVWSLGMLLVAALTQRPMAWDGSPHEPAVPESLPEPFRGIARACLRQNPSDRCSLEYIREHLQIAPRVTASQPATPQGREPATPSRPRSGVTTWVIAGVVVLAGLVGLRLMNHRTQPAPAAPNAQRQTPAPTAPPVATTNTAPVAGAVSQRVMPDVPRQASQTIHGKIKVSVRASVDNAGNVSAAVLDHAGSSRYFANLALEAARRWKFTPPQKDGQTLSSKWLLRFQFTRTGTEASAEQVTR
jgi:TonB family protein